MNAYLFTAVVTRSQVRPAPGGPGMADTIHTWDSCASLIVGADNPEAAEKRFEGWLRLQPEGENPVDIRIRKIAAAQFVDQLLTESGNTPIDWPVILKQAESQLESTPVEDFEQGYWVDVNSVIRPEKLSFSAGTLQSDVPEDIRSGLNWLSDRKFLFIVSILSPLAPQEEPMEEPEPDDPASAESPDENTEKSDPIGIGELYGSYPQALDKEAAALIQARNSVVAAWLWCRFAANTRLAGNQIRIDPWCGAIGLTDAG